MSSPLDAPLRALADVIRQADAPDRLRTSVVDFMAARGVRGEDLHAMATIPPDRWLVYRRLVLNRFVEMVENGLPRTAATLGRERLVREVERFIDQRASQSPYLRDIVAEFVTWASDAWSAGPTWPWLMDLARHELLGFEVSSLADEHDVSGTDELAIGKPVVMQRSARLARYAYAVHDLPDDITDRCEPVCEETAILAYRDREHRVRFLKLGPLAAALIEELMAGELLGEAIRRACEQAHVDLNDAVLGDIAVLLADLADRGVLRGAVPCTDP